MKEKILMSGLIPCVQKQEMKNLRDALVRLDPENGDYYEANYDEICR